LILRNVSIITFSIVRTSTPIIWCVEDGGKEMGSTNITNGLLAIIALSLIWIAFQQGNSTHPDSVMAVRTASAQSEGDDYVYEEPPLEAICTLSFVEEAAVRALIGGLQNEVITALNQTNQTLWNMQGPVAEMLQLLGQMEILLQHIAQGDRIILPNNEGE
jgi:hypothetical protein